jgi:hypothetical protein
MEQTTRKTRVMCQTPSSFARLQRWMWSGRHRKHSLIYCCVLDRVYRAVAWQRVAQIRYNINISHQILSKELNRSIEYRSLQCNNLASYVYCTHIYVFALLIIIHKIGYVWLLRPVMYCNVYTNINILNGDHECLGMASDIHMKDMQSCFHPRYWQYWTNDIQVHRLSKVYTWTLFYLDSSKFIIHMSLSYSLEKIE